MAGRERYAARGRFAQERFGAKPAGAEAPRRRPNVRDGKQRGAEATGA